MLIAPPDTTAATAADGPISEEPAIEVELARRVRVYTNDRHPQFWFTDGTLDWLWPAAERAGVPVSLGAAMFLPTVGQTAKSASVTPV